MCRFRRRVRRAAKRQLGIVAGQGPHLGKLQWVVLGATSVVHPGDSLMLQAAYRVSDVLIGWAVRAPGMSPFMGAPDRHRSGQSRFRAPLAAERSTTRSLLGAARRTHFPARDANDSPLAIQQSWKWSARRCRMSRILLWRVSARGVLSSIACTCEKGPKKEGEFSP